MAVKVVNLVNSMIILANPAYSLRPFETKIFPTLSAVTADLAQKDNLRLIQAEVIQDDPTANYSPIVLAQINPRVAYFGPSHADLNPATTDVSRFVGVFGTGTASISPERHQTNTYYPNCYVVANGGIGGQTTTDMLNRTSAASSTGRKSIQDVLNTRPHLVELSGLDTNNFANLTPANYRTEVDKAIKEHRQIVQAFVAGGPIVVDEGNHPYSGTGHTNPDLTRKAILETNAVYKADVDAYRAAGLKVRWIPAAQIMGDANGDWLPNFTQTDANPGLHRNLRAEQALSFYKAAVLVEFFGPPRSRRYEGANLIKNAATATYGNNSLGLVTTTGGGTRGGPVPVGFGQGNNGNITRTLSQIEVINGKRFFTMTGTPSAVNNTLTNYMGLDLANFPFVAGDVVGIELDILIADANGGPPPQFNTLTHRFNLNNGAAMNNIHFQNASGVPAGAFPEAYIAHVVWQPFELPALGTLSAVDFYHDCNTNSLLPWKLGTAYPNLVKIGSNGVIDPWHI